MTGGGGAPHQPTLYDVARLAGVSHQTVSRFVTGFEGIRPATRAKVEAAIAELGYRPNLVARSLATRRSHRIGALVYEMLESGPSATLNGASIAAREAGYVLDIVSLDAGDPGSAAEAIEVLMQHDLAGVLAFAPTAEVFERLSSADFVVPVVVEGRSEEARQPRVPGLSREGLEREIDHLVALGHRSFFFIGGPPEWFSAQDRRRAYERALDAHDLVSIGSIDGDWSARSGYEAAGAIPLDRTTAVVVANDQMALGVLRSLRERGCAVPEDVSVVGFDDIPEAAFFEPPLTTVRIDFNRQGRLAIERLLREIEPDPESRPESRAPVRVELVVRSSTAVARVLSRAASRFLP